MAGASEESKGVDSLKNFERALGHVRNSVRPLTLMSREEVGNCVSAADRAKLSLQVAYGVSSLFYMFLKTQGVSPSSHPVKGELDRIRGYFGRLKRVGQPPEQRSTTVDKGASRRFIDAALSGDSVWQNAKGTDSASAQQKRAAAGIGRSVPAGQPENIADKTQTAAGAATAEEDEEAPAETTPRTTVPDSSGGGSKRKHAPASAGARADPAPGGGTDEEKWETIKRSKKGSGGGGSGGGSGSGKIASGRDEEAGWGDGPEAAVPTAKKAKASAAKSKKKPTRYRTW